MNTRNKVFSALTAVAGLALICAMLLYGLAYYIWDIKIDEVHTGLQEGISRSGAKDSPVKLPINATNIYYEYEAYWQGGATIARYDYPHGDIKKQAATHLRAEASWVEINADNMPTIPEHQFSVHTWFQPNTIANGYECVSDVGWETIVWIDMASRTIYVLEN
jgi:hypothetical protein